MIDFKLQIFFLIKQFVILFAFYKYDLDLDNIIELKILNL